MHWIDHIWGWMIISALWRLNNNKVPQLHPSPIGQHSKLLRCFWEKSNTALFSLFAQKLLWTAATFSICQKLLAELLFCYQKYIGNYLKRYFIKFHKICQFGIILKQGHQRFTPEYVIKNQTKPHLRNYSFLHSHFLTSSQTKLLIPWIFFNVHVSYDILKIPGKQRRGVVDSS